MNTKTNTTTSTTLRPYRRWFRDLDVNHSILEPILHKQLIALEAKTAQLQLGQVDAWQQAPLIRQRRLSTGT